jgi:hypothetical protein
MCTTAGVTKPTSQPLAEFQSLPQPVVIIAKHLCGVATDLAIHSARSFPHIPRGADGKTAILLCCVWTAGRVYTTLLRCTGIEALVKNRFFDRCPQFLRPSVRYRQRGALIHTSVVDTTASYLTVCLLYLVFFGRCAR